MKQSEPNPLQRELARGQQGEPHPDIDVLTALSEDALLQSERQRVLAHLAACPDCREVLSIAAAAAIDPADDLKPFLLTRPTRLPQRAWMSWASIAAGLLIVCSTVAIYQYKLALPKNSAVATNETVQLPPPALEQSPQSLSSGKRKAIGKAANAPGQKKSQEPLPTQNISVANAIPEAQIEAAKKSDFSEQNSYQANAVAGQIATPDTTVLKAAPAPSAPAFGNEAMERTRSAVSITAAARPHWRINGAGHPERSYVDGAWQAVLPHEQSKMRVVSVFGDEVWIGGDSSRLYHSADNGTTWNLVVLPDKNGRVHSISHIHFQTAQSGAVEADDGAIWITSNGGNTWK